MTRHLHGYKRNQQEFCRQGWCVIGRIDLTKQWHTVILVLLDEDYDATEILEAGRRVVTRR